MITVFTPTFNRASLIHVLYNSLLKQTNHDFEWLIVDDGSTDETKEIIDTFILENRITIRYVYQKNGGKHRALNKGVILAKGEWFFVVDSDDSLPPNALKIVSERLDSIKDDLSFSGISCMRANSSGKVKDTGFCGDYYDQYPHKIDYRGDFADVSRTCILREFPFPDIPSEKFCAECLVIFRISQKYKVRYYKDIIYICEYLEGGLTDSSVRNRRQSAGYTILTNLETMSYSCPLRRRLRAAVNFWRFIWFKKMNIADFMQLPWYAYFFIPFGVGFVVYDGIRLRK